MKKSVLLIVIIIISLNSFSENNDFKEKFKIANRLYTSGQFEEAVKIYEELTKSKYESPELYFNLANSYYRMNNVGLSIYWYKKAEILNPLDEDIKYNLELANLRVENLPPVFPKNALAVFYDNLVLTFPCSVWGIASIIFFLIFISLIFLNIKSQISKTKKLVFIASMLALFFSLISILFTSSHNKKIYTNNKAVVISSQIMLKSTPGNNGNDLFPVYEGFFVTIENNTGEQVEIKLSDGRKGWISTKNLKIL